MLFKESFAESTDTTFAMEVFFLQCLILVFTTRFICFPLFLEFGLGNYLLSTHLSLELIKKMLMR